jgi:hypothetical protein
MERTMNSVPLAILLAAGLFFILFMLMEAGRRFGVRRLAKTSEEDAPGLGIVDGAIFSLLGLLIAFTFSGAAERFEAHRQLLVEETNDIGTAYLRIDMLPSAAQPDIRANFRQYVDARLAVYRAAGDASAAKSASDRAGALQAEIWSQAVTASQQAPSILAGMLLLPAVNAMIDITTTRAVAMETHPPAIIYGALLAIMLISAVLAGYGLAGGWVESWVHTVAYCAVMVAVTYVIVDYEFPRLGLIRVDAVDQILVDLRNTMN